MEGNMEHGRTSLRALVVGVDGSAESLTALRWAVDQVAPDGSVHAVHVVVPTEELALDAALGDSVKLQRHREAELRDVWVPKALAGASDVEVVTRVREGHVSDELRSFGDRVGADAIVVGHHPHPRLGPQLVGHVTARLLRESARPVVIVPSEWMPGRGGPVTVGVGVSKGTEAALSWTTNHLDLADTGLLLVHAHGPRTLFRQDGWLDVVAYHLDPTVLPDWVEDDLLEIAGRIRDRTGTDVDIAVSVQPGRTGPKLVEAGTSAGLLVVGRGEPPFVRGHAIAPYLRHAIVHAPCPIVVVPADR